MMLRRWPAFLAVLGFAFLPATLSLVAQRVPVEHVPEMPTHELNEERGPETKTVEEKILVKAPELNEDGHSIEAPGSLKTRGLPGNLIVPTTLHWEKTQDSSGRPSWSAKSQSGVPARIDLNKVEEALGMGAVFINEGNLPHTKEWRALNSRYPDQMIVHEPESANQDLAAMRAAIRLGNRPLDPAKVKVFNALPHETELEDQFREQTRMGVGGTLDYWKGLHKDIEAKSGAMIPHRATKEEVLEELRTGTSPVVMLYAHSDGEQLYMPGAHGGTIHADELAQIDRRRDPGVRERIVILVACNAGARTSDIPRPLTSVLLEKGVARTVFATDRPFDSRDITNLLKNLANGMPPRKAVGLHEYNAGSGHSGSFLQQFVELQSPVLNGPAERDALQHSGE